jgi:hypothetical protein
LGTRVQALANHALDENQLNRLAGAIKRVRDGGYSLAPLVPFSLGIVGNATTHPLIPVLISTAARHGIDLILHRGRLWPGDAGSSGGSLLDPLGAARCGVLIALDHRVLPPRERARGFLSGQCASRCAAKPGGRFGRIPRVAGDGDHLSAPIHADRKRLGGISERVIGCAFAQATGHTVSLLMNVASPRLEVRRRVNGF